jgi:23S rRNA maturation-related 3'-5' exoribonuclease YhaM
MIVTREHFDAVLRDLRRDGLLPTEESLRLLQRLVASVISDPSFYDWPASRTGKHHFFRGGLATHTYEVLVLALASAKRHHEMGDVIDFSALVMAAIWHDVGKIQEYRILPGGMPAAGREFAKDYVTKKDTCPAHHITRAAFQLGNMCATMGFTDSEFIELVLHLVEAHHGRREWGSPNVPGTLEAMILHHADMQSVMRACGQNPAARP